MNLLDLLQSGILGLSGWGKVLVTFVMLQISMMATTLLSHFGLLTLYLTIAGLTLAMLWAFLASRQRSAG